jgi:hypothetical protein
VDAVDAVNAGRQRRVRRSRPATARIHADVSSDHGTIDVSRSTGIEATRIVIPRRHRHRVRGRRLSVRKKQRRLLSRPGGFGPRAARRRTVDGYVEMSGGTLLIDAGGDGFDSNGDATVTGGTIVVNGPTSNGNGALDVNGELLVSDAVLLAAGSAGMAETPSVGSAEAYVTSFNSIHRRGRLTIRRRTAAIATLSSQVFSRSSWAPTSCRAPAGPGRRDGERRGRAGCTWASIARIRQRHA